MYAADARYVQREAQIGAHKIESVDPGSNADFRLLHQYWYSYHYLIKSYKVIHTDIKKDNYDIQHKYFPKL